MNDIARAIAPGSNDTDDSFGWMMRRHTGVAYLTGNRYICRK